jgi:hypothetical protein
MSSFRLLTVSTLVYCMTSHGDAGAGTCGDPSWTRAITEAMGRMPKTGECNPRLYGDLHGHEERVFAVRSILREIYLSCGGQIEWTTQKLPLHVCQRPAKTLGQGQTETKASVTDMRR